MDVIVQREFLGRVAGLSGLALYNWWVVALFDRRMLPGVDELFSDLEATGQPHAALLSRTDVAAGMLILSALLLCGPRWGGGRPRELLLVFAAATVVGGLFPYTCAEGVDRACRRAEWSLALPWPHYVHIAAGVVEFGAATAAIVALRTQEQAPPGSQHVARGLTRMLVVAYPLLGLVYLTDRLGALMEPVFFASFSTAVALVVLEPVLQSSPADQARGIMGTDPRTS